VAECLEEAGRVSRVVLDEVCDEHPDAAAEIRDRFKALAAAGLLGPLSETALTREADPESDSRAGESADTVGPYRLLRELGRGGQAAVYLAEDTRLHRHVALKVLSGFGPLSETAMRRFRREAEVASRLDHPGICPLFEAGIDRGTPFIAMRHVEGVTLAERIAEARMKIGSRPLEDGKAGSATTGITTRAEVFRHVRLIEKAARALHAAHEAGIVHRDVKPGNIMVTSGEDPVLLDFGLAAGKDSGLITLTRTGDVPGTLAYMSPEQLTAESALVDRRTDVYSLGVTLYECLTLERPFRADTREAMVQAIQYQRFENPRKRNRHVSRDLEAVLETALEKDRNRRYQTALDFAEDLRRVREAEPIAARPPGALGRTARWARRRPARAALLLALVLGVPLVTGLGGYVAANLPNLAAHRRQSLLNRVEASLEEGYDEPCHGSPDRAHIAFDAALELDADRVEAVAGRALSLLQLSRAGECLAFLDGHGEITGANPALSGLRVDAYRSLGKLADADELAGRLSEPDTALGFFIEGSRLLNGCEHQKDKTRFVRALHCLTRAAFTASSPRLIYHLQLAHAAGHLGDRTWARRAARSLRMNWPASARARRWAEYAMRSGHR